MKSLALSSARPRIYSDLRAAAALGGYYFNLTNLAPHLDFTDAVVGENYTCSADGVATNGEQGTTDARLRNGQQILQQVAASGF